MKKLLILIACAYNVSINAMEPEPSTSISSYEEIKALILNPPHELPQINVTEMPSDQRSMLLTSAQTQLRAKNKAFREGSAGTDIVPICALAMLTSFLRSDTISTYEAFQEFLKKPFKLQETPRFEFSQLTPTQRDDIFTKAVNHIKELQGAGNMVRFSFHTGLYHYSSPERSTHLIKLYEIAHSLQPESQTN